MAMRFDASVSVAAAALFIATDVYAQLATGEFERTIEVDDAVVLEVQTGSGSIEVRQGPPGEVRVHGSISVGRVFWRDEADAQELVSRLESAPPIAVSGGRIEIGRIADEELRRNVSISYDVVVPADTTATSRTGSGDQTVMGLTGDVEAVTGSGDISADGIGGDADLRTGSGSIDARNIEGRFTAKTGSGSIRLEASSAQDVDVTSGSGDLDLAGFSGLLLARAGSGDITVAGTPTGTWEVQTGSGSIDVHVPEGSGFDIDAHTGSGGVNVEPPVTMSGQVTRNALRGRVGNGGARLNLRTGSGSIRVEQQ